MQLQLNNIIKNCDGEGKNIFHWLMVNGDNKVANLLAIKKLRPEVLDEVANNVSSSIDKVNAFHYIMREQPDEVVEAVVKKMDKKQLGKAVNHVNKIGESPFVFAVLRNNPRALSLIIDKLSEEDLGKAVTHLDKNGINLLYYIGYRYPGDLFYKVIEKIPEKDLKKAMPQIDSNGDGVFSIAAMKKANVKELKLIVKNLSPDVLGRIVMTYNNQTFKNNFYHVLYHQNDEVAQEIIKKIPQVPKDYLDQAINSIGPEGANMLMIAAYRASEAALLLMINRASEQAIDAAARHVVSFGQNFLNYQSFYAVANKFPHAAFRAMVKKMSQPAFKAALIDDINNKGVNAFYLLSRSKNFPTESFEFLIRNVRKDKATLDSCVYTLLSYIKDYSRLAPAADQFLVKEIAYRLLDGSLDLDEFSKNKKKKIHQLCTTHVTAFEEGLLLHYSENNKPWARCCEKFMEECMKNKYIKGMFLNRETKSSDPGLIIKNLKLYEDLISSNPYSMMPILTNKNFKNVQTEKKLSDLKSMDISEKGIVENILHYIN